MGKAWEGRLGARRVQKVRGFVCPAGAFIGEPISTETPWKIFERKCCGPLSSAKKGTEQ